MEEKINSRCRFLNADTILLGIILIAGAVLRFYNYSNLPYSFDEFSALFRTRFDNFHDLIYYGVTTTDTHPAGVQVFMYYWVMLFGESEMVVKLPFILFGLGAIVYGFKIGKIWFNSTVGLFIALFLSVLQYPITYSQFARPYSSGLFFSVLMVWFWTYLVFYPERKKIWNRVGFILSAAICAYNHHFSMFLAVLVGVSGLFFVSKNKLLAYLLVCLSVIVLYLPHLSILIIQINKGGVEEWLAKPGPGFILDYFGYILHYSKLLISLTVILIIGGFVLHSRKMQETNKFRILAISWFGVTFLTGYFYSVYVNALLQYSVLIFVFPFLVMFVFSFYRGIHNWMKVVITTLFMTVAIFTLIYDRLHYEIMYDSVYEGILIEADKFQQENRDKKVTTIIYEPQKIREYYLQKHGINDSNIIYLESTNDFIEFREFINNQNSDLLVLGLSLCPNIELKMIVEEQFPYLLMRKKWFKGDLYLYSKTRPVDIAFLSADKLVFTSLNTFGSPAQGWDQTGLTDLVMAENILTIDTCLNIDENIEYSPTFKAKLKDISKRRSDEILISVDVDMPDGIVNPAIVCDFNLHDQNIGWLAGNVGDFVQEGQKNSRAYLAVRLMDMKKYDPETVVTIYIWNRNREKFHIDNFRIEVREGNTIIYGLFEKF